MDNETFKEILQEIKDMSTNEYLEFLQKCPKELQKPNKLDAYENAIFNDELVDYISFCIASFQQENPNNHNISPEDLQKSKTLVILMLKKLNKFIDENY